MTKENLDQIALRKWITAGLQIQEVSGLNGDAGYLLSNMIAKYTWAADEYRVSAKAASRLNELGVDMNAVHSRSKFYGKKSPFLYEHSMPASLVRRALLEIDPTEANVLSVLQEAGQVVVVLREEDESLRSAGLSRKMPADWREGDSTDARYAACNIEISAELLKVNGAIQR